MTKLTFLLYSFFLFMLSVFSYSFIDPGFYNLQSIYTGLAYSQRTPITVIYLIFILVFFSFYIFFLWRIKNKKFGIREVKLLSILSFLFLVASYPSVLSYDLFNYMTTSKVLFFYGENPYLVMPIEFINEPFLNYTRAANKYALYGPSWILLSGIPFYLSFQNTLLQMFLFKIFIGIFYLLTTFLIYKLSKNIFLTAFFSLNPFILIEIFISAHNDIVMMFLALSSFYFFKKKRVLLALLCMFLSILIKFATIFLILAFAYILWRIYKNKEIEWESVWKYSSLLMIFIFLLSPIREELYPWYFVWVFPFIILWKNRTGIAFLLALSFGLLLYYIPYMYTGNYLLIPKYVLVSVGFIVALAVMYKFKILNVVSDI